MTPNDKDFMERYMYQVIRRVPKAQREEVRMELEELISDMYADKGSMEEVLTQLGDPADFAKTYRNGQPYLIGPDYLEAYWWFVKVVLLCTALPILAVSLVDACGALMIPSQNAAPVIIRAIVQGLLTGITDALLACLSAFGAVTVIFAIMERGKVKIEGKKAGAWPVKQLVGAKKPINVRWTPKFLEPVPDAKAMIRRGDSLAGIVFLVIFTVLLIVAPHFFAAIFVEGETVTSVPVFNLEQWETILPLLVISLFIGLIDEILRFVVGCYNKIVMVSNIVCGMIQIVFGVVILKVIPLWNPRFVVEIQQALKDQANTGAEILTYWNADLVSNGLLVVVIGIILFEMGVTVYKTLHYGGSIQKG